MFLDANNHSSEKNTVIYILQGEVMEEKETGDTFTLQCVRLISLYLFNTQLFVQHVVPS